MTLTLLASWTLRSSLLLIAGLAAARIRSLPADARHRVLAVAVAAALLVPAVIAVVPAWHVAPLSPATLRTAPPARSVIVETSFVLPQTTPANGARPVATGKAWSTVGLLALLAAGAGVRLAGLALGLAGLRRLGQRATPVTAGPWSDAWTRIAADRPTLSRVRLLQGDVGTPVVTWGWWHPRILLPADSAAWSADRIRVVLAHECAHIERADWLLQTGAECLKAIWWFNPLAWIAASQLRIESEHACDDLVVVRGVPPTDYADHLVALARLQPRWPVAATAMAHPSTLERRIRAMLDTKQPHGPMSRAARLAVTVSGLGLTVLVASLSAQTSFATLNGTVHDPLGGTIPKVTLKLTRAEGGAKYEVTSADGGAFEFVGLPAGNYALEASVPGFRTFALPLQLAAGSTSSRNVTLEIGQLQETITVRDVAPAASSVGNVRSSQPKPQPACTTAPNSGGLRPPTKTRDVRPDYPGAHHASGTEAVVTLRAVINTDGTVGTVDTVESPAIEFAEAAKDAVRQWRFTPTLLNCIPVEVQMNVAVLFKP